MKSRNRSFLATSVILLNVFVAGVFTATPEEACAGGCGTGHVCIAESCGFYTSGQMRIMCDFYAPQGCCVYDVDCENDPIGWPCSGDGGRITCYYSEKCQ